MDNNGTEWGADMVTVDAEKLKQQVEELEPISRATGYGIAFIQSFLNGEILKDNNRLLREILAFEVETALADAENARQRAGLLKKIMPEKPSQET